MRTQTIIILFSWLWILAIGTTAHAATFEVSVINKTSGQVLINYPVTVWVINVGQPNSKRQKIRLHTDQNGRYQGSTSGLSGKILVAEVNFRGLSYISVPATINDDNKAYRLEVDVFEITSRRDAVHIASRRMLLKPRDTKTLEIDDLLRIENNGTKTYMGAFNDALELNEVLYIPMPKEYVLQTYQTAGNAKINRTGNAIITHNELPPGKTTISMRYAVHSDTGHFDLRLVSGTNAPKTERFLLYVPAKSSWNISTGSLKSAGSTVLEGTRYDVLQGTPGSVLRLAAESPIAHKESGMLVAVLIAGFLLPIPVLLLFRRRLRTHSLRQEHALLMWLQKEFSEETRREDLIDYYQPLLRVLTDRTEALTGTYEEQ